MFIKISFRASFSFSKVIFQFSSNIFINFPEYRDKAYFNISIPPTIQLPGAMGVQ